MTQFNLGSQRVTVSNTVKGVGAFISVKKKVPALRYIASVWRLKFFFKVVKTLVFWVLIPCSVIRYKPISRLNILPS